MKKILIVTGRLAFDSIQELTSDLKDKIEILKLPISIAAFISSSILLKSLKNMDLSKYEYILCPGLMRGNLSELELGIKVYKGPRYAYDIPTTIKSPEKLSTKKPADIIFLEKEIKELEGITQKKIDDKSFLIGKSDKAVYIGVNSYPIIIAEIVNAPKLSTEKNIEKAKYYASQGADVIDIGAIVGEDNSKKLKLIVESLKNDPILNKIPISIDSLNPAEIESGVEAGADLILSLDKGNMKKLSNLDKDIGVIVLPTNVEEGFMPHDINERIEQLNNNIQTAKQLGFQKIIADPLLEAPINPGLFNSLEAYYSFRKSDSNIPLMFGIGNVIELIDADGVGVNAIFACLAFELKVSVFLTTEYSTKTRGTVNELSHSLKMAFLANKRNMVPKDLPITVLKSKSKNEFIQQIPLDKVKIIEVEKKPEEFFPDTKGFFRIWINHDKAKIFVAHYRNEGLINIAFSGTSAENLGKEILTKKLITSDSHALYLGRELEKAEICLYLGKSYMQDLKFGEY
ncbi:MAG: dihydropteroate synthase-like protein [Candidatus Helarchaeota archaeon]|nr:dihydropteroate synthase-like protein [Candidatus Helarchaeota archaeon]